MNELPEFAYLHQQAMDFAEQAFAAKRADRPDEARAFFKRALNLDQQAAMLLKDSLELEPTRSVLFRSAATLALDCGETRTAEKLIGLGLAGNPPEVIAEELRDLYEDVSFQRHLNLRGITLSENQLMLTIHGPLVGHGVAPLKDVIQRIETTETILLRTAERKLERPYRSSGIATKDIREKIGTTYLEVQRAASYAVVLRLGTGQLTIPGIKDFAQTVVKDMVDCLGILVNDGVERLRAKIPEQQYLNNFVSLSKALSPDGQDVSLVGFTVMRDGEEQQLALRKNRNEIIVPPVQVDEPPKTSGEYVQIVGQLRAANSIGKNEVILIGEDNLKHEIIVGEGLDDIVKIYWKEKVIVSGYSEGNKISATDIELDK